MARHKRDVWWQIAIGVNSNLLTAVLIGLGQFVPGIPASFAWIGTIAIWVALWITLRFIARGKWSDVKHIGYYFLLTAPFFWAVHVWQRRILAENKAQAYQRMIDRQDDAEVVGKILSPSSRVRGLKQLIGTVDGMNDKRLAMVLGHIHRNAWALVGSRGSPEDQALFLKVVEKASARTPNDNVGTYDQLLFLLSQVYGVRGRGFNRRIQRQMMGPLQSVLRQVGELHLGRARKIVDRIMNDPEEDHEIARSVMKMVFQLNVRKQRTVFRLILDRSLERSFMFPATFGLEFLCVLDELGERLFWVDRQSLRELLTESVDDPVNGVLARHESVYRKMKLSAILQDPRDLFSHGICIFRGVRGDDGRVLVACTVDDKTWCKCHAECLSFDSLLSRQCKRVVGTSLKMRVSLPDVQGQLELHGYAGRLSADQDGVPAIGRMVALRDGEEQHVKKLYDYLVRAIPGQKAGCLVRKSI